MFSTRIHNPISISLIPHALNRSYSASSSPSANSIFVNPFILSTNQELPLSISQICRSTCNTQSMHTRKRNIHARIGYNHPPLFTERITPVHEIERRVRLLDSFTFPLHLPLPPSPLKANLSPWPPLATKLLLEPPPEKLFSSPLFISSV